jgi:CheY-like chemotaxis protein
MMGGTLEVRSEPGTGSEFFFTLSLEYACEDAEEIPVQEQNVDIPDFHGSRVLLAEDNELNREIAQTILEMNGFTVACAADGQEALDLYCGEEPGWFDVILMDIRMPVMDGLESARRIRTSGRPDARRIPIIALTANAFDEDTRKSLASGMNGHLSKPIQVDQMLEILGKCMGLKK